MATMTQAEYARHRGISKQAVGQAVKAGRLTLIDGRLDPLIADVEWDARTDASQQKRSEGNSRPPAGDAREAYFAERRRREKIAADLLELQLRLKTGEVCLTAEKDRQLFNLLRALRDRILGVPDRILPLLISAAPDGFRMAAILENELKDALRGVVETHRATQRKENANEAQKTD